MRLDTAAHLLALEVRDTDVLVTNFYSFDLKEHRLTKMPLASGQSWWQGLEDADKGLLLLHGYGDRKLGEHRGIKAFDVSGILQWEQPAYTFYGVAADGILAFEAGLPEEGFIVLHSETGQPILEDLTQAKAAELVQTHASFRYGSCTYPVQYSEGEAYFDDVVQFIKFKLDEEAVKVIEYAEYKDFIVASYYLYIDDDKLDSYLVVFDLDGNLKLKECIGEGLSGLGSDTFIIFNQNLYFVQHRQILKVYKLF